MTTQATQTYNFPNITKVQFKTQGASAWQTIDKPDNKQINQHAALGDQVTVWWTAQGIENKGTINPPERKSPVSKYDHKVGSFAWNNLSMNEIRTHVLGKRQNNCPVIIPSIAGHNLAPKLAELSKAGHNKAIVNGSVILDSAALKKFELYVNGESAPKIDKTPHNKEGNKIEEYTLADVQITLLDTEKVDEKGKNRAGYARFKVAGDRVWFKEEPFIAQFGKAPYWHRELKMYILPVADFAEKFGQLDLQLALNLTAEDQGPFITNAMADAAKEQDKPEVKAAAVAPTAQAITPEQIAAIVAQAVVAAMSAIVAK